MDHYPGGWVEVTPSLPEIRAQVSAILEYDHDARIVAMHAGRRSEWPADVTIDNRTYQLAWCDSPLAARMALRSARQNQIQGLVLLTPLSESDLGADVLARVSRARVFRIHQWEIVSRAFRAKTIDGRLSALGWMADALIERMPAEGYSPTPTGILDADTAWRALLRVTLGMDEARMGVEELLRWTVNAGAAAQWSSLPTAVQEGLSDWLAATSGSAGELIMGTIQEGFIGDAIPLGLIAEVLIAEDPPGAELVAAAVRVERFTGGLRIEKKAGARWAEAARRVMRELTPDRSQAVLSRADRLLTDLYLSSFAIFSSVMSSGMEARLIRFAEGLQRCLASKDARALLELESLADAVSAHAIAAASSARMDRVEMATRLVRWWMAQKTQAPDFQTSLRDYATNGAFVDWARLYLLSGDQLPALSTAFDALSTKIQQAREQHNEAFARSLKVWNETPSTMDGSVPVEAVLERVVAPLSDTAPVLLLVMDGLSLAVFAELFADVTRLGWDLLKPDTGVWSGTAVAALPTVTDISRASLLCGRLCKGGQHAEKAGFAQHAAFARTARAGAPRLFHKGELMDGATMAPEVQAALSSSGPRVVGAIYNAIDDQLDGSTQIHMRWTLDRLRMLGPLLYEARTAGRVIVLTADHGHVLEHETAQSPGADGGDRWRRSDGDLRQEEIAFEGGRVLTPAGETRVTLPWSEQVRYGMRKNGYHGGASPQEVLVPLCVLAPSGTPVSGWTPAAMAYPEWWDRALSQIVAEAAPQVRKATPKSIPSTQVPQTDLFASVDAQMAPRREDWTFALLQSPMYRTQKALAARVAPPDDLMHRLLEALSERGGKLSKGAVASRLSLPPARISGFISAAQRLLNVDQSSVLTFDERSGVVEFNRELLEVQFGLRTR
jgi:hypothetical protein